MLSVCSHKFFWPRRAADGHYYQVCLVCGAQYEYDWKNMRRMEGMDRGPAPTSAPRSLTSNKSAHRKAAPHLRLLLELEPAHRVFFRNLADILLFRSTPPVATTSRPAPFWRDVFVYAGVPWWRFAESMLCHTIAVAVVLILSQGWEQREQPQQRRTVHTAYVTYYTPPQSFPALGSSRSRVGAPAKRRPQSAQRPISVAPERTQRMIRPPDIKLTGPARPNIAVSNPVPPAIPLAATGRSQLTVPVSPTSAVAPPPTISQATARPPSLPQASVVAPPPDVEAVFSRHAITAPNVAVIAPPPTVQGSIPKAGDINIGHSEAVKPSPQLPTFTQRPASGMAQASLGNPANSVVPPPPSVQRSGTLADERVNSFPSASLQAVPPAPSVQNSGSSDGGGRPTTMDMRSVVAQPPSVINSPRGPAIEDLPLRLIGLAFALPSSSYFSNYEVFIAERWISKQESQLIKLVYVFLPYQRRLSEYGLNNSRVYKLRVRRDPTCDETLLQMTWPESDPHPESSTDSPALSPNDRNSKLPCYRTTADENRRALSRAR